MVTWTLIVIGALAWIACGIKSYLIIIKWHKDEGYLDGFFSPRATTAIKVVFGCISFICGPIALTASCVTYGGRT